MKSLEKFLVRKAAVLGSGVMGSQIAAHLANANISVILFDLPQNNDSNPNALVERAIEKLHKLEPAPLVNKAKANLITAANYNDNLDLLADCDFIIEAVSEQFEIKKTLYSSISPYILKENAVLATNTSGLSVDQLSLILPEKLRPHFCGVHFFNPPRYMMLVELIAHKTTDPHTLDKLETFLTTTLGKGVVRAKDTPNFIANRIGVFSMLSTLHHTLQFKLGFDEVDALTGISIGRAKSATYRTLDIVGIDTFAHVTKTMRDTLTNDPWSSLFVLPSWFDNMIKEKKLGQKTGEGIYKKIGKEILVFDLEQKNYRPANTKIDPEIEEILKIKNPQEKFKKLHESRNPKAQFLWAIFRDLFHYCATWLFDIAHNARDLDFAIRWGYGWAYGPFETWQTFGWHDVVKAIQQDIKNGKTISKSALPNWASESSFIGVHTASGSYSAATATYEHRPLLPVYKRQLYPEILLGEPAPKYGKTAYENEGVRLWTLDDEVGILSFKSKMHAVGGEVLDGMLESLKISEQTFMGTVLWQTEPPFSAGANLKQVTTAISEKKFSDLSTMIQKFQAASMALKYSLVPTVAAVRGMALGGGCEFVMHCAKTVAHVETYMGLVEIGVGLLPAGGGCKEFALRAAQEANGQNIFPFLQKRFETIAKAKVSKSAHEAKALGYLRTDDIVVFHPHELLYIAIGEAKTMYESGYRPNLIGKEIPVVGSGGIATIKAALINMLVGEFISEYDFWICEKIATILCGDTVIQNTLVSEQYLLDLELAHFMDLLQTKKTQDRIDYMLKTGKPLRN